MANQSTANKEGVAERRITCPRHGLRSDGSPKGQEYMVLRTFFITPKLDMDLRRLASQAGISKSELINTILTAHPKSGNCKKCAKDLEKWKAMVRDSAKKERRG